MKQKTIRYSAKFIGFGIIEKYTDNLIANPALSVRIITQFEERLYEVIGPIQTSIFEVKSKIRDNLASRAEKLNIIDFGLVDKVCNDIVCAQEGEIIAFEEPVNMLFCLSGEKCFAYATLNLRTTKDENIDKCAHQYALLRLAWLANLIGMSFEESPECSLLQ